MNWCDEKYVKLYTRNTATWVLWPWQARAIFAPLLRATNYAGILETGNGDALTALAALIMFPREVVEVGINAMLETGTLEKIRCGYLMPKYIEAQEATKTDTRKKRDQRERQRAQAREFVEAPVTECHQASPSVTECPPPAQHSTAQPTTSPPPPPAQPTVSASAEPEMPLLPLPKTPDDPFANGDAFFAHMQLDRHSAGLVTEKPPQGLNGWFSEMMLEFNGNREAVELTVRNFARDPYWRKENLPIRALMKNWRKYAPQRRVAS